PRRCHDYGGGVDTPTPPRSSWRPIGDCSARSVARSTVVDRDVTGRQNNSGNMRYRKLRIGGSVGWGLASALLIVLWIRSELAFAQFIRNTSKSHFVAFTSFQGRVALGTADDPNLKQIFTQEWTTREFQASKWHEALSGPVAFFPATLAPEPN